MWKEEIRSSSSNTLCFFSRQRTYLISFHPMGTVDTVGASLSSIALFVLKTVSLTKGKRNVCTFWLILPFVLRLHAIQGCQDCLGDPHPPVGQIQEVITNPFWGNSNKLYRRSSLTPFLLTSVYQPFLRASLDSRCVQETLWNPVRRPRKHRVQRIQQASGEFITNSEGGKRLTSCRLPYLLSLCPLISRWTPFSCIALKISTK